MSMEQRIDIIGKLPIEIAQEVFKYLNGSDLSSCCRVSKQWRNCANFDILWKQICIKKGIICKEEYYNSSECVLDPLVDWGHAYMEYVKKRFDNWHDCNKIETTINSCYGTISCCDGDTLVFTIVPELLLVYDMSRKKPHCVQKINLETDQEVLALEMTRGHLIIRQGDAFAIYVKKRLTFTLKGYLLRLEDCYVFTQHFYETNKSSGCVRYGVIEDGIVILLGHNVYLCNISGIVDIRVINTLERFFIYDHFRFYVVTGEKRITGFDININYEDFDVNIDSVIAFRSNRELIIGLFFSNQCYDFKIYDLRYRRKEKILRTHRPYGFEVHPRMNRLAYVALDKFNQRVMIFIYEFDYDCTYTVELNETPIAQAKLFFIGRDLLFCATRCDWDIYDMIYVIDLKSMKILYDEYMFPKNIISVDSKHAVYSHGTEIQIHTYLT